MLLVISFQVSRLLRYLIISRNAVETIAKQTFSAILQVVSILSAVLDKVQTQGRNYHVYAGGLIGKLPFQILLCRAESLVKYIDIHCIAGYSGVLSP